MKQLVFNYFSELQAEFGTGRAREHSYRPALKELIQAIDESVIATNEPSRVQCGAPDFVITRKGVPVGYGETKDLGENLDAIEKSEQIERYLALDNLFLTDYLEFRFFLNNEKYETIRIGEVENGLLVPNDNEFERLVLMFKEFARKKTQTIKSANQLAKMMADKAKLMKEIIHKAVMDESKKESTLHEQLEGFRKVLIHDMTEEQFADIYAQTIAYGLFVARFFDPTPKDFSRREAEELIPKSNPFLRKLFHYIAGPELDERINWIVDALADIFVHADVREILKDFGSATRQTDPVIHFYETFLKEYDPALRKSRGVYYTPEPVVSFIVRSVDAILKSEFGLSNGLADTTKISITKQGQEKTKKEQEQKHEIHKVQILDPAAGTGTFLNEVIKQIYTTRFQGQEGIWHSYVHEHLLPRLHGFELMMAPYTMCHLKLGLTLVETGYKAQDRRISVYLTNSLEEVSQNYEIPFAAWLSEEANEANKIKKETPIMVVMGNPPYSVSSSNTGEWIRNLIADYKEGLNEKKLNLDDDYIKFLRYAQYYIEKNGQGIVAMITNNSFLDGVTHRRMRERLLETFDKIYIYDLHGSATKKEVAPDGGKDKNVFDIMQGVSINIFIKTSDSQKHAQVFHFDSYGLREKKYDQLWNTNVATVKWGKLKPVAPHYFFIPSISEEQKEEYEKFFSVKDIFIIGGDGMETKRDKITMQFTKEELQKITQDFSTLEEDELRKKYQLPPDGRDWKIKLAQADLRKSKVIICDATYRPFDHRKTVFTGKTKGFIAYPREKIMSNFLNKNVGLIVNRFIKLTKINHFFITEHITEKHILETANSCINVFPLYLYSEQEEVNLFDAPRPGRKANLNEKIMEQIESKLGMQFVGDGVGDGKATFGPEDLLDYIYAILYSPTFRERYKEFLKIDFPRVPFTGAKKLFWELVEKGHELRGLHLLKSPKISEFITHFSVSGNNAVEKVKFEGTEKGKVWINGSQYFDGVPEIVWNFYIGGYQPAQKWLKDRKGRTLTSDGLMHYQKIIVALTETDRLMKEIDGMTADWI